MSLDGFTAGKLVPAQFIFRKLVNLFSLAKPQPPFYDAVDRPDRGYAEDDETDPDKDRYGTDCTQKRKNRNVRMCQRKYEESQVP